ncbi:DUF1254 domain-containing protein [Blastomonas sp.]|uniref:DUF1254 domain-containing protein n=1 Tax=Blastomonas sp. TaxID=1909299 RepID=UPI003593B874
MKRWLGPLLVLGVAATIGWYATLAAAPQVIMARAWDRLAEQAGVNRMTHSPLVTASRQTIVRPSPDLAYSVCAFDLSDAPLAIHAQPVPGHYWSLTVFDHQTNVAFVASDRDSKGAPVDIVLATAGQQVPVGVQRIDLHADKGVALIRVLVNSRETFDSVREYRNQSWCRPVG